MPPNWRSRWQRKSRIVMEKTRRKERCPYNSRLRLNRRKRPGRMSRRVKYKSRNPSRLDDLPVAGTLVIVGRPNVGKSSLFNRLVERDRAIVTATPGTTRDLVTERISLDGIPLELVDTAGLRETVEEVEQLGVARTREALADASASPQAVPSVVRLASRPVGEPAGTDRTGGRVGRRLRRCAAAD